MNAQSPDSVSPGQSTLGAILAASILSAIGIACWNLLPVTLGSAAEWFSLSDQQLGLLGSSLLTGWLIATVPAFFFMHALNRKGVALVGVLLAAVGSVVAQYFESLVVLYVSWAVAGFGMALVYCVSIQLIAELGDIERSFGYKLVSEVTGGAILLLIFPALLISTWAYAGSSYGIAAVYFAALLFMRWITPYQPAHILEQQQNGGSTPLIAWVALLALLIFLSGITGLWAFLERIGNDIGVSKQQLGVFFSILKLVGGLAGLTVIFASAKYGLRWPHVVTFLTILTGVVMLYFARAAYPYAVGTWFWEYGFSLGAAYQFATIARLDTSNRLLLLIPSCIGLAGMIGPALAGYLKQGDSFTGVYIFAVLTALVPCAIYYWILTRTASADQPAD